MKIRMDVDGREVFATLEDAVASRDFAALLPLSLTLSNYAQIERIADLPEKLSIEERWSRFFGHGYKWISGRAFT
ncbi:MAG: cyclophilin-like fold protein [Burkholderiales bacterium]